MDKNLNAILMIDQKIGDFYYDNIDLTDNEFMDKFEKTNYISKALKIISKLSNKNVLEVLKRSRYLTDFIDLKKFLKPYKINKKYLKENKELYIEEYKRLRNTCNLISNIATSNNEFYEYMDVLNVDDIELYLLNNMPNEQIYTLASETGIWDEKLFYFSFFKNKR